MTRLKVYMNEMLFGKPIVGFIGGYGSFLSAVLTVLGILTPLIGFIGCVFGTLAAYHSWKINRRRDRELERSTCEVPGCPNNTKK